jgi:hypothetical protein
MMWLPSQQRTPTDTEVKMSGTKAKEATLENVTPITTTKAAGAKAAKPPIDMQKLALAAAMVMGLFGGGSYAVSPWATSQDVAEIKEKLEAEIRDRQRADKAEAKMIKAIAKKVGVILDAEGEPETQKE